MISTSKLSDCSYTMHGLIVFKCKFPDTKYQLGSGLTWIQKDKTMPDKLMYIPSDSTQNYLFCWLQFVVETFGHSTKRTNKSKFNKSP